MPDPDRSLERLTDDQLRNLMLMQFEAQKKAIQLVEQYDKLLFESASECLRRWGKPHA